MRKSLLAGMAVLVALTLMVPALAEYIPGEYTAEAAGHSGTITVTVTIGEDGTITDVKAVGEQETPTLGGYAMEDLAKDIVKAQSADVDVWTGATNTSKGMLEAVNACLAQASGEAAAEEAAAPTSYKPGEYTAEAAGHSGTISVTVTIGEDGTITDVKAVGEQETPTLGGYAMEDLAKDIVKAQSADVDVWTGATNTSKGMLEAVRACLEQASE